LPVAISERGIRKQNEDAALSLEAGGYVVLAVADGLGGHARGEIASRIAIENLRSMAGRGIEKPEEFLTRAYERINSDIKAVAEEINAKGMATTLTAAVVERHGRCTIANLGDSRAYVISGGGIVLKTRDHSYVQELVERGVISEEEAFLHAMKNILTRALGLEGDATPDLYTAELEAGDVLLLSTDGLHDYVRDEEVLEMVRRHEDEEELAEALMKKALKVSEDNVSIALMRWRR